MLRFDHVDFQYKKDQIFSQASILLEKNNTYFIFGKNGAGKTTFLHLCANLLSPTKGQIHNHSSAFSYLPAHQNIHPLLKIKDLIDLYSLTKKDFYESFTYKKLDLQKMTEDRLFGSLSSGQKQRLLLALSLSKPADIVFFDEPFNHLDMIYQNAFLKCLSVNKQKLQLIVSHELSFPLEVEDAKILLIENQKIHDLGPSKQALESEILQKSFHITTQITDNPINGKQLLVRASNESKSF